MFSQVVVLFGEEQKADASKGGYSGSHSQDRDFRFSRGRHPIIVIFSVFFAPLTLRCAVFLFLFPPPAFAFGNFENANTVDCSARALYRNRSDLCLLCADVQDEMSCGVCDGGSQGRDPPRFGLCPQEMSTHVDYMPSDSNDAHVMVR